MEPLDISSYGTEFDDSEIAGPGLEAFALRAGCRQRPLPPGVAADTPSQLAAFSSTTRIAVKEHIQIAIIITEMYIYIYILYVRVCVCVCIIDTSK